MNRGDIWFIDLGGKSGKRPVVIVTRQNVIEHLNKVAVVEITTKGKGYPTEVYIDRKGNLPKNSFVQTDNIHTVPKNRLVKYAGTLDGATMMNISVKIILALGLEGAAGNI
ncbi:MAG: type II toxin-antitoxin system PemK/MazF family toxin [Spirochaetales bacterium]|nr:type II toxin-antitoxin system PemK/MazF family toxin [Spirochaetales bacterium]